MDTTPSSLTGSATPPQRTRKRLAIILAGLAVAASIAWTPALLSISRELDDKLDNLYVPTGYSLRGYYTDAQLNALVAQARQQFSMIAFIYLAALVALVALSIVAGRRALRETASAATLMRMGRWSLVCLVGGLALALGLYLISFNTERYLTYLAVGLVSALEVVSIILGSIALLRPTAAPASGVTPPTRGWRIRTRIGVAVASLSALTLFALVYLFGAIFIGFLLGFEF